MKRINCSLICCALIILLSDCDKEKLNTEPSFPTEASFYKTDADFLHGITAAYAKLTDIYWFNNNSPCHGIWMLPGDDLTSKGRFNYTEYFLHIENDRSRIPWIWRSWYQLIARSNLVLDKIETADSDVIQQLTSETLIKIRGEALFLRSLAYYKLWNLWGTAPLQNHRLKNLKETQLPNSKDTELLDQAITDLKLASGLLPSEWPEEFTGRATRDAACGLLGKCLVFRANYYFISDRQKAISDYRAAIEAFDLITDHSLEGVSFGDNFNYIYENNNESLFEFQAGFNPGWEPLWRSNDLYDGHGAMHAYWGFFNCEWTFWDGNPFIPTQKLINSFEPDDPRAKECFDTTSDARYNGYCWTKYVMNMGPSAMTGSLNNPRILRYADILLLKAESILQSEGNISESISLINQVRTRARGTDSEIPADLPVSETNREIIMQWIMDERFRELSGEDDHRWFDLKRWQYAGFIDMSTWERDDAGFSSTADVFNFKGFFQATGGKMWFPIPEYEILYNHNIQQNPGYLNDEQNQLFNF